MKAGGEKKSEGKLPFYLNALLNAESHKELARRLEFKNCECGSWLQIYRNTDTKEDAVNAPEGKSTLRRDLHGLEERPTAASGGSVRPNAKPRLWGTLSPPSSAGKSSGDGEAEEQGLLEEGRRL